MLEYTVCRAMSNGAAQGIDWLAIDDLTAISINPDGVCVSSSEAGVRIWAQRSGTGQKWLCVSTDGQPRALWIDEICYHVVTSPNLAVVDLVDSSGAFVWRGEFELTGQLIRADGLFANSLPHHLLFSGRDPGAKRQRRRSRLPIERLDDEIMGI